METTWWELTGRQSELGLGELNRLELVGKHRTKPSTVHLNTVDSFPEQIPFCNKEQIT